MILKYLSKYFNFFQTGIFHLNPLKKTEISDLCNKLISNYIYAIKFNAIFAFFDKNPVYSNGYRYPFIPKAEVQKEIIK